MIDKLVYRELEKEAQKVRNLIRAERGLGPVKRLRFPLKQVLIVTLMLLILGCWVADSLEYHLFPEEMHNAVATYTDPVGDRWNDARLVPGASQAVAHNPINGSPISAGSVLVLVVITTITLTRGRGSGEYHESV